MTAASDIHFVLAYLVALCAVVFSWNALGLRVMNAVLGVQLLAGLVVAALLAISHRVFPPGMLLHVAGAAVALILYAAALRVRRRDGGSRAALALAIAGLLCVFGTLYLGVRMQLGGFF